MFYVYIIRSIKYPSRLYIGYSTNVASRLDKHNNGDSSHTAKYRPWKLTFYCAFVNKYQALEFESYLKSGSGSAFMKKRLLSRIPVTV